MRSAILIVSLLSLAAAACGQSGGNASVNVAVNAAAPVAPANQAATANQAAPAANSQVSGATTDRVLRTETVTGTFTGWEMGDYLWAKIDVPGLEPISAQPGPTPIDLFLDANRGRPVTVDIATVRTEIPEAGGMTEIQRITAARNATTTADAWWQSLSAADRAAAQRRFEANPLSGGE